MHQEQRRLRQALGRRRHQALALLGTYESGRLALRTKLICKPMLASVQARSISMARYGRL